MKRTAFTLLALFSAAAFADGAEPVVSDVTVSQAGRVISVHYTLTGADAIVTATFKTNGVIIDCGLPFCMVGDVARKVAAGGERAFYWAPDLSDPDFAAAAGQFLLIDLAGAPTPERVAGFLGVGLLLLLGSAGYIRAASPRRGDAANDEPRKRGNDGAPSAQ